MTSIDKLGGYKRMKDGSTQIQSQDDLDLRNGTIQKDFYDYIEMKSHQNCVFDKMQDIEFEIPESISKRLHIITNQSLPSIYTVLVLAFCICSNRYTNKDIISICSTKKSERDVTIDDATDNDVIHYQIHITRDTICKDKLLSLREEVIRIFDEKMTDSSLCQDEQLDENEVGLVLLPFHKPLKNLKNQVTFSFTNNKDHLGVVVSYSKERYPFLRMKHFIYNYINTIEKIFEYFNDPIHNISVVSEYERNQINSWNNTEKDYEHTGILHHLIEQQVKRTPDFCSVIFKENNLSYRELNQKANQLARYLIRKGVKTEDKIGVYLYRSLEMVISLYAVIKAGACYVPLDPDLPKERIAMYIMDSNISVIFTQKCINENITTNECHVITLDDEDGEWNQESSTNLECGLSPENAAYMIYTSGSTGKPKGVTNSHRGITNRLLWMQDQFRLAQGDRVLQKTPFCFDVSVWEFFWPLIVGATLVVADPGAHKNSKYISAIIQNKKINVIHFVPSMLRIFLQNNDLIECSSLKYVMCSGEALSDDLVQLFYNKMNCNLVNLYGPTEAAVDVTYWVCDKEREPASVPIGKPIANTQIFILDEQYHLLPVGAVGELFIGGVGLARGYEGRPGLTADKFIPNLFSELGTRLYRTGDLARYRSDGLIEYIGRMDDQVKIRGFRIELGEIESLLKKYPGIKNAAVDVREYSESDKRLIAYLCKENSTEKEEIRAYLKKYLPDYMIPSDYVFVKEFPITINGKLDRKALRNISPVNESSMNAQLPISEIEKKMCGIWMEILHKDNIGITDNFFDLGGHSLLLVALHDKILEVFQVDISLVDMFKYTNIKLLSDYIDNNMKHNTMKDSKSMNRAEIRKMRMDHRRK
jgi:amino acid adenylation domain-containing protein